MKKEIWQTTNQQPWVEALAANIISVKTRMSYPLVPVGATVLLHASKSRLWPHWKGLRWTEKMDSKSWGRGTIEAVAIVEKVDETAKVFKESEYRFWDVYERWGNIEYNSVGIYAVRFSNIQRLKVPIQTRGYQSPYVKAKPKVVELVLKENPEVAYLF